MTAYYNEIDEDAADVLRELIRGDVIAPGDVDTRSIKDVQPDDLRGYDQCHFFAGGGLWSVAARLAGWPDDRPLWTGSCPCQPYSSAGKGLGADDPRHLWPDFHRLIRARRPAVVMGEQVARAAGYGWFDGVCADLAEEDYACRGVDIPACAVDAPHQRGRLYWCAVADSFGTVVGRHSRDTRGASGAGEGQARTQDGNAAQRGDDARSCWDSHQGAMADMHGGRRDWWAENEERQALERATPQWPASRNGSWWADAEWITCHDGKARRTKPGLPLLVDGLPGRVGLWRIAGNAISPILAAEVIAAFVDTMGVPT